MQAGLPRRTLALTAMSLALGAMLPIDARAQGGAMMGAPLYELTVGFPHDSAVLTREASRKLSADYRHFYYQAGTGAIVTGYANPSEKGGETLAQRRADAVFDALVKLGAAPATLREGDNRVNDQTPHEAGGRAVRVTLPPK